MLANTLNTNEVKNSAGTEVEFEHVENLPGRGRVFRQIGESPNLKHRFSIRHQELGSGADERRRSALQFIKEFAGVSGVERKVVATLTLDIPVGDISDLTNPTTVMAELMSFVASLGATTTILYDGTGNGAAALINGSL
jgi:hypothetical protein